MFSSSRSTIATILVVLASLMVLALGYAAADRYFLARLAIQNDNTLRLVAAGLRESLLRFEPLALLIADRQDVKALLADPQDEMQIARLNEELRQLAAEVGASDIYVMDPSGTTLTASNFDQELSFVGKNFSYRPYFLDAMDGQTARFFALGTTSLKRGYYFAAPVVDATGITGVVALKIGVNVLEENWRNASAEILVSDTHNVIFMASNPSWLFKALEPLTETALNDINVSQRYPIDELSDLNLKVEPTFIDGVATFAIQESGPTRAFLATPRDMPDAGWRLHVLAPRAIATGQAATFTIVLFLVLLLILLIVGFAVQRRARLVRSIAAQQQAQEELERRVAERTEDLNIANTQLRQEVSERTQAEEQLRSTQNELIQAGKLAALGQMSAALSHELNQPLAAVKSYADNARTFLDRKKVDQAKDNIGRISELADRMAELGRHLRNFARKPKQKVDIVSLASVIASVEQLMSGRLRQTGARLEIEPFDQDLMVNGGQVRLQQVLVNLINNAIDASQGQKDPKVKLTVEETGAHLAMTVRDFGSGIDNAKVEQIFDPFFTTKGVNEGLGLGLSISYNIIRDFGGSINAANHPEGGAVFTVSLVRAHPIVSAAE